MRFVVISSIAAVCSLILAYLISALFFRKNKEHMIRNVLVLFAGLYLAGGLFYFSIYNKATPIGMSALESDDKVEVSRLEGKNGFFFDGPGTDKALIFYPGAKIATEAYAPLLHSLAADGVDAFVIDMPFHLAFFGRGKAAMVFDNYSYDHWYMGGHSLGGVMAAAYTSQNYEKNDIEGLILMGSYPQSKVPESIAFYSVVGSEDHIMDLRQYEKNRVNWSENAVEIIIEGGNHSQFANYGLQRGDGEASITIEEQQKQTIDVIHEMTEN
ncbi:MAG: alpha/beta hydrolase [Lachnospiraceae bacterium]|nr:alpha/beta hydrolase [Lachnospiraceae bacterium]